MSDNAGFVDVGPARRLANLIATVKVVLISLSLIGTAAVIASSPSVGGLIVMVYGLITAAFIYVTFGWFEHTLRLLIGIAFNTAEAAELEPGALD